MKHIFTISILFWSVCLIQAQVVPNGVFEEWDTTSTTFPVPLMWIWTHAADPFCPLPASDTIERSFLSSSGCCSAKISTGPCKLGFVYTGAECMARPAYLNFQYMFHPEGGDSAYVYILLYNYDEITSSFDTVGFASGHMHEEVDLFTPFSLPVQYFNEEIPAFMRIFFSTSKTHSELYLNGVGGPPGNNAAVGTSLWLDDVHLSGTTGIQEYAPNDILTVFPNPAGDRIWFKELATNGAVHVRVFDAKGAQMMDQRITDPAQGLDVKGLRPGVYSIMMLADAGGILRANWVKE